MARAATGLGVRELAEAAGVSPNTIARLERGEDLRESTVAAIKAALEVAGVEFIPENGGGAGVRLKTHRSPYDYFPFPIFEVDLPFGQGRFGVYRDQTNFNRWTSLTLIQLGNPDRDFEDVFSIPFFWFDTLNTADVLKTVLEMALSKVSGPRKPEHPSDLLWILYQPDDVYPGAREFLAMLAIDWEASPPQIIRERSRNSLTGNAGSALLSSTRSRLIGLDWWRLDSAGT